MAFEYLAEYTTFESVEEMDRQVEQHITLHYYNLTASERAIVFAISKRSLLYPGASHLKASTIAEALEISTKTFYRSIKKLVELNIIEKVPGTKLNGIKGASIYKILPYNVPTEMSERVTTDEASDTNAFDEVSGDQSFNSFNLSKTSPLEEIYNNAHAEKKAVKEYMNEWEVMLFDFMHGLPLADSFKDELYKLVLASQVDGLQAFHKAKEVLMNLAKDLANGTLTITKTTRSVFVGAYKKAVIRSKNKHHYVSLVEEKPHSKRPVDFYNWLDERESAPQINNYSPIENWLEW